LKEIVREIERKGKQEIRDPDIIVPITQIKRIIGLVVTDLEGKFPKDKIES
jgi:hypothetical protein